MLSFFVLNCFYIPFSISFDLNLSNKNFIYIALERVPLVVFITDIVINLNTAYYCKCNFIYDKKLILKNYYKKHFFLDFITLGPSLFGNYDKIFQILFLLRIIKLAKLVDKMKEYIQIPEHISGFLKLLGLLIKIVYLAHLCGCIAHFIAQQEIYFGYHNTWLHKNHLEQETVLIRYINSVFYSVLTMLTVGFIDTDSHTEKAFFILIDLVLAGTFAYAIGSMGIILQDMVKNENELKFYFKLIKNT